MPPALLTVSSAVYRGLALFPVFDYILFFLLLVPLLHYSTVHLNVVPVIIIYRCPDKDGTSLLNIIGLNKTTSELYDGFFSACTVHDM